MNIRDLIPTSDQWKQLQDVESSLLRRKRVGNSAGIIAALSGGLQLALVLANRNYLEQVGKVLYSLVRFRFDELAFLEIGRNQAIGWIVLFLAAVTYYTLRRTNLLLKESKEPFRYTFWIQPFTVVQNTPLTRCKLKGDDRFQLLHHDLAEHLTQRIQRFSILEVPTESGADGEKPVWLGRQSSHIHISGSVAVREEEDGKWVLHVMPLLRMGPAQFPATLAPSVKYPLNCKTSSQSVENEEGVEKSHLLELELTADEYNQMVERVYSRVATEVYAQIELDIRTKIALFPTSYTRAVALYNEAEDFARSNTIDAYERSIALYRDALRYFELMPTKWLHYLLLHFPLLWRREVHFQHQRARVVTGYTKCLIYKNRMSTLSGRDSNPLYELPELLAPVIHNVEKLHRRLGQISSLSRLHFLMADVLYPKDSWFNKRFGRSYTRRFEAQKRIQFELYIVEALVHFFLGSWQKANGLLERAQATAADRVTSDPLYLLARGLVEPVPEKRIPYFRQAVDNEPNFQMAQWFLAQAYEKEFRVRDEIKEKRALSVINEYTEVLKINYGNIAALAAQGHLLWLISSPDAKRRFEEGREIKAIARETFVGQLNYSLARIAAEDGEYDECRNRYTEAVSADPTLGAHVTSAGSRGYRSDYDDIGPEMLQRFRSYKEDVEKSLEQLLAAPVSGQNGNDRPAFTEKTLRVVHAFVLNDYANACLRYFHQHGSHEQLQRAIRSYEKATQVNPTDALPWFNLQNAYGWEGEYVKAAECFPRARELAPSWSRVAIDAARDRVATAMEEIKKEETKSAEADERLQNLDQELFEAERELERRGVDETTFASTPAPYSPWSAPLIYEVSSEIVKALKTSPQTWDALTLSADLVKALDEMKGGASSPKELLFEELENRLKRTLNGNERHLLLTRVFQRPWTPATPAALQGQAGADPLAEQQAAVADLLQIKERLTREQETARREVADSKRRLEDLAKQFRESMNFALKELNENSRLAALFEGPLEEQIGRLVAIPWRKLDVSDVETLIALAEVLARGGADQPEYLAATQRLAEHLLEMYPEDDRVVGLLRDVVPKLISMLEERIKAPPPVLSFSPRAAALMRDALAKVIGALEKKVEVSPEKAFFGPRAIELRRKTITKFIAVLEKKLDASPAMAPFSPRAAKRKLNHLNALLKDSHNRWKTIVDYWMQTDSRTFISLYWYVLFDPQVDRGSLDKLMDQYFKRDKDVFENLLGHVYFRLDSMDQAIEAYNKAASQKTVASYHFNLGKALSTLGRDDEARSAFYRAHRLDKEQKEYGESLAHAYNALANKHYFADEFPDAIDNYLQAISLCGDVSYFHSNLSSAWEYTEDVPEPIALQKAIDTMQVAHTLAPDELEYKNDLNRLRTRQTMMELYGQGEMAKRSMSVTRVAIEFAQNLSDLILGEDQQDFAPSVSKRISEMLETFKAFFGVDVPTSRWRYFDGNLPDGAYIIIIDEVPLVMSTVYPDKKLCLQLDELAKQGIPNEAAKDPESGDDAAWVQKTDWGKATTAGLKLLDPVDVILRHLKRVMSENLADFLGHSEVSVLLKKSEKPNVVALANSPDAVNTLTMVLRGLLAEEVPIAAIEEICNYFLEAYGNKSIETMIEELRMRIKERLPGNSGDFTLLPIGKRLEKAVRDSLVKIDITLMPVTKNLEQTMQILAPLPETCQEALMAIRSALSLLRDEREASDKPLRIALVVSDYVLRNPLHKLVELEFPNLPVLCSRELLNGVQADLSRTVDLK